MGRPKFEPKEEQRQLVKSFAAIGTRHEDIALKIGIRSPKTLRKYFATELNLGAVEANYRVGQTLFKMATSGDHPAATIFWSKVRMGWRERGPDDGRNPAAPPFIVAREEGEPDDEK